MPSLSLSKTALCAALKLKAPLVQAPVSPGKHCFDYLTACSELGGLPCLGLEGLEEDEYQSWLYALNSRGISPVAVHRPKATPWELTAGEFRFLKMSEDTELPDDPQVFGICTSNALDLAPGSSLHKLLQKYPGRVVVNLPLAKPRDYQTLLVLGAGAVQIGKAYCVGEKSALTSGAPKAWEVFAHTALRV